MRNLGPDTWITVAPERTGSEVALALLAAGHEALLERHAEAELQPPTPAAMAATNLQFLVARQAEKPVGCIALVDALHYGVLRRLYVVRAARGRGVAAALVRAAESLARDIGLRLLRLETGTALPETVALYRKLGYAECDAFGAYPDTAGNLFMEKRLL